MSDNHIERARHVILNVEYKNKPDFGIQMTGYYKPFYHLLKSVSVNDRQQFTQINGAAYGLEFELKASIWGFRNSISYVLSRSRRSYTGVTYDTNFDRLHRLHYLLRRNLGRWSFSLFWEFHSGQPYSPGKYRAIYETLNGGYGSYEVEVPPGRIRYPDYHRLDICLERRCGLKWFVLKPYLSIRNVYNRKNVLYYGKLRYGVVYPDNDYEKGRYEIDRGPFSIPTVPTIGFGVEF